eukprot:900965_1
MSRPATSAIIRLGPVKYNENNDSSLIVDVSEKQALSASLRALSSLDSIELLMSADQMSTLFDPLAVAELIRPLKTGSIFQITVLPGVNSNKQSFDPVNNAFLLAGLYAESERIEGNG